MTADRDKIDQSELVEVHLRRLYLHQGSEEEEEEVVVVGEQNCMAHVVEAVGLLRARSTGCRRDRVGQVGDIHTAAWPLLSGLRLQ